MCFDDATQRDGPGAALILGLEMAVDMKQLQLQVFGDYQLHVPRKENKKADALAALASTLNLPDQTQVTIYQKRVVPPPNEDEGAENELDHLVAISEAAKEDCFMRILYEVLHQTVASWLFDAWGLDVVGPLLKSSGGHLYFLAATDYFSKWAKAVALKEVKKENVANFIRVNIIYRFVIPRYIIEDNGKPFDNKLMNEICDLFGFKQRKSSMYHAAANGLAEAFNKTMCNLLKKIPRSSFLRIWRLMVSTFLYRDMNFLVKLGESETISVSACKADFPNLSGMN
ncbi:uncharacterized protein LOC132639508 [Lycium barbarum]|uniref:uncharacterized protein LOC132639508 n=1 Tax=Lycium barbarum TaxID=112863 RepID=UPI00293F214E|nr:uncharacterized protein LOC132639508 [Lycium barbarum]